MDYTLIFLLLDNNNCYSLIGKVFNETYKDNPAMLKQLLDILQQNCDTFNYKKNKGKLNIEGLCRFVCHKIMDGENRDIFNAFIVRVAKGEIKIIP